MLGIFFWKLTSIAFPFVILILQNYIQRNKLYHGIWKIFMILVTKSNIFLLTYYTA